MLDQLRIGIKRLKHRRDDDRGAREAADAEFSALRPQVLDKAGWRCARCGIESRRTARRNEGPDQTALQVHHADDDHANNDPANLHVYCNLDHAVHHMGCDAPSVGGFGGMSSQMQVAYIPALTMEDVNLFQRAIGAALSDPELAPVANKMLSLLGVLTLPVREVMGSSKAADFAAAMGAMDEEEYAGRQVDGLRVLFHPSVLKSAGADMLADYPLNATKTWQAAGF